MPEPLSYHVYDSDAREWYNADEDRWSSSFHQSTAYSSLDQANDVMTAKGGDYVFACMPSA